MRSNPRALSRAWVNRRGMPAMVQSRHAITATHRIVPYTRLGSAPGITICAVPGSDAALRLPGEARSTAGGSCAPQLRRAGTTKASRRHASPRQGWRRRAACRSRAFKDHRRRAIFGGAGGTLALVHARHGRLYEPIAAPPNRLSAGLRAGGQHAGRVSRMISARSGESPHCFPPA